MNTAPSAPRGAIYLPARAFNTYQQWKNYNPQEAARDMGYAASINLNSLRVWLSFHHWLEAPEHHEQSFDHFLDVADKQGIQIMAVLFECCGIEPTEEARNDTDFATAVCIKEPGSNYTDDPNQWDSPKAFVDWFLNKYGADERIIAIDAMNEPVTVEELNFAREICRQVKAKAGRPLTLGLIGGVRAMVHYHRWDLDVYQYHYNFPQSEKAFEVSIEEAMAGATERHQKPMWVAEWQRVRPSGSGWGQDTLSEVELGPDLASLAHLIHKHGIGHYFWSLMLKPAYLAPQRAKGTFNGLFHEDGSVYSLEDARAVSGNMELDLPERKARPDWFA